MSQLHYLPELTAAENVARARKHFGLDNHLLAAKCGVTGPVLSGAVEYGFKTAGGHETENTIATKKAIGTLFTNGIPKKAYERETIDLFSLMGCADCQFRSRSHRGCLKFSLEKHEINKGAFIHTSNHGAFALSKDKPCPYANGANQ
jgi:hypothetical protein